MNQRAMKRLRNSLEMQMLKKGIPFWKLLQWKEKKLLTNADDDDDDDEQLAQDVEHAGAKLIIAHSVTMDVHIVGITPPHQYTDDQKKAEGNTSSIEQMRGPFPCNMCNKSYKIMKQLQEHNVSKHGARLLKLKRSKRISEELEARRKKGSKSQDTKK